MILTLPYPPSSNRYWRVWRGRAVKSEEARDYQRLVVALARQQGCTRAPLEGEIELVVSVYRPRKAGDLDNCLKVAVDALKGLAFVDDKQVVRIEAERNDDKHNPRIVIQVRERVA